MIIDLLTWEGRLVKKSDTKGPFQQFKGRIEQSFNTVLKQGILANPNVLFMRAVTPQV
ncbi:hypothetical protein MD484_g3646, partial [Candolleomyces efflorescens]